MSVCLSVSVCLCTSVFLSVCLICNVETCCIESMLATDSVSFVKLRNPTQSVFLSVCLFFRLSASLCVCLFVCLLYQLTV